MSYIHHRLQFTTFTYSLQQVYDVTPGTLYMHISSLLAFKFLPRLVMDTFISHVLWNSSDLDQFGMKLCLSCGIVPDSKTHGANMDPPGADRTKVGPMLAPWTLLSGIEYCFDFLWSIDYTHK